MKPVSIFIRFSDQNISLKRLTILSQENGLIYNDEGGGLKAHLKTSVKFSLLTAASPLVALVRLIRSVVFGNGREFIGALLTPMAAAACLTGSLLSLSLHLITWGQISFYENMRRTYSSFEAWINKLDLDQADLPSYANRVSSPLDYTDPIWTTAPCMQPVLENGISNEGGLLDRDRMQKIFPFVKINGVQMEGDRIVVQSEYKNEKTYYSACNGACEHAKLSSTCCCCYRIDAVLDRFLCCTLSQGSCSPLANSSDSCGIVSCSICGIGVCCCYAKEDNRVVTLNTGCFGPTGPSPCYVNIHQRV